MGLSVSENDAIECRTKRISKFYWAIFALVFFITQSNAGHIDFDDAETLWLKNVAVNLLPANSVRNQTLPVLKVTGLATTDIEDGVRIKATLSQANCMGNESDLQIISQPRNNSDFNTTDLILSLDHFDFKRQPAAYLCIKTKYDHGFQHMGTKTKFPK